MRDEMPFQHRLCFRCMTEIPAEHGVEFRHLRAFVAVARERNFTRAAHHLRITQPALSRTVASLERLLGTTLLARNRRTVQLTAAGQQVLPHVHRVLAALDEAVRKAGFTARALLDWWHLPRRRVLPGVISVHPDGPDAPCTDY